MITGHESRPSEFLVLHGLESCLLTVCFVNADSFGLDHFDQYIHLIFWLKVLVHNDTVFEANVLELDRYEPRLDANVHAARSAPKSETAADVTN